MAVSIGEISTEFTTAPAGDSRGSDSGSNGGRVPDEVRVEEIRAIVRELLVEELERYLRLAVDR
jgi:hypothetical protein